VMLLEAPYMKANGVTVVPPVPSLVLPEPVPLPQDDSRISSMTIASRRLDLFMNVFSMSALFLWNPSILCGTIYIFPSYDNCASKRDGWLFTKGCLTM